MNIRDLSAQVAKGSNALPVFLAAPQGHEPIYDGRNLRTLSEVTYHLEKLGWNGVPNAKLHVVMWDPNPGPPGASIAARALGQDGAEIRIALRMASRFRALTTDGTPFDRCISCLNGAVFDEAANVTLPGDIHLHAVEMISDFDRVIGYSDEDHLIVRVALEYLGLHSKVYRSFCELYRDGRLAGRMSYRHVEMLKELTYPDYARLKGLMRPNVKGRDGFNTTWSATANYVNKTFTAWNIRRRSNAAALERWERLGRPIDDEPMLRVFPMAPDRELPQDVSDRRVKALLVSLGLKDPRRISAALEPGSVV
jgi:hypothetical protein